MMILINRSETQISGSVNGKQFGVSFDEQKYQKMLELKTKADSVSTMEELKAIVEEFTPLTEESYKDLVETKTPYIVVNKHTNKFYLRRADKISSQPLPQIFVNRILKSVEKNIDITPLIKCWARYMRPIKGRPVYNLQQAKLFAEYIDAPYTNETLRQELLTKGYATSVAAERATTPQVSITQEGLLVCYKVSKEVLERYELNEDEDVVTKSRYKKSVDPDTGLVSYDEPKVMEERLFKPAIMGDRGDAFNSGDKLGHFIRVGQAHWLDKWEQVSTPGSKGLHCGGLRYIAGYQQEGTVTHYIFVDPMDIHTIAGLGCGNDGAMTVKRYFVHASFAGVNRSIYHSSEYAKLTDAEYALLVKEAVEANEMKKSELDDLLEQTKSLSNISNGMADGNPASNAGSIL